MPPGWPMASTPPTPPGWPWQSMQSGWPLASSPPTTTKPTNKQKESPEPELETSGPTASPQASPELGCEDDMDMFLSQAIENYQPSVN